MPDHPPSSARSSSGGSASGRSSGCASRTRRPALQLHRRPDHGEQPDGRPPRLGPHAEGRLPALQGAARLRPALPERLRLPGPLGRGRGREGARPQLEARDRGVRPRRVRRALPRARRRVTPRCITEQSKRLGHVDGLGQRLLHLHRHEHRVHLALPQGRARARLAVPGPPLDAVVPALRHVALAARAGRRGELRGARAPVALRPLPAERARGRGARRLDDDAVDAARERRRGGQARRRVRAARRRRVGRRRAISRGRLRPASSAARSSSGSSTSGPFDDLRRRRASSTASSRGTRSRSTRAPASSTSHPGAGAEDFELSRVHDLPVLVADRRERPLLRRVRLASTGCRRARSRSRSSALRGAGLLVEAGTIVHRYPICWRCDTPLVFRVVDDWFIAVDELRAAAARREREVEWTPPHTGKRMDDWLRNMGDWNISRKRYFGLPLPFYPCACGHLNVIGSQAELEERATGGLEQLQELHRPWIDEVPIRCERAATRSSASPEVGDAWLDAGIVPFSTLGWENPEWIPEGYATGAARGSDRRRPARPRVLGEVVPGRLDLGDARADPALVLLAALHVGDADRAARRTGSVLSYEKLLDEHGPRDAQIVGEHDRRERGVRPDGRRRDALAVLRSAPSPEPAASATGRRDEVKRRLLTLWNSVSFLVTYANIEEFEPVSGGRAGGRSSSRSTAGSSRARASSCATRRPATSATGRPPSSRAFEAFVDDLSNWYIRRSRRRFWNGDETALQTLWDRARPGAARDRAGDAVPRRAPLADARRRRAGLGPPRRLARARRDSDEDLLDEIAAVRRVVELGRQARSQSGIKLRQPLRRLVVQGAGAPRATRRDRRGAEREGRRVRRGRRDRAARQAEPARARARSSARSSAPCVRRSRRASSRSSTAAASASTGTSSAQTRCWSSAAARKAGRSRARTGYRRARPHLDDELELEGRVRDLIHQVNGMRREAELNATGSRHAPRDGCGSADVRGLDQGRERHGRGRVGPRSRRGADREGLNRMSGARPLEADPDSIRPLSDAAMDAAPKERQPRRRYGRGGTDEARSSYAAASANPGSRREVPRRSSTGRRR